ncbi:hypothetical protein LCGC14_2386450, partial [marine sediment metagenome]
MKSRSSRWLTLTLAIMVVPSATAEEPKPRELSAVQITDVQITDTFWAARMKICREATLPYCFDTCESTGRISNFVKAAGRMEGKFEGIWFNDSDVYKVL